MIMKYSEVIFCKIGFVLIDITICIYIYIYQHKGCVEGLEALITEGQVLGNEMKEHWGARRRRDESKIRFQVDCTDYRSTETLVVIRMEGNGVISMDNEAIVNHLPRLLPRIRASLRDLHILSYLQIA